MTKVKKILITNFNSVLLRGFFFLIITHRKIKSFIKVPLVISWVEIKLFKTSKINLKQIFYGWFYEKKYQNVAKCFHENYTCFWHDSLWTRLSTTMYQLAYRFWKKFERMFERLNLTVIIKTTQKHPELLINSLKQF